MYLLTYYLLLLSLFLAGVSCGDLQSEDETDSICNGDFDFYFLLDKSGSIGDDFPVYIVPFVEKVVDSLISDKIRISYIVYSYDAVVILEITNDEEKILNGLEDLRNVYADGGTVISTGLDEIRYAMKYNGTNRAAVILAVTDGQDNDMTSALKAANLVRSLGASIFAIGVGQEVSYEQLTYIADSPSSTHVIMIDDFGGLDDIINTVVNRTCIEIISADPLEECVMAEGNITLIGRGFQNGDNASNIFCIYHVNTTFHYYTNAFPGSTNQVIKCPLPYVEEPSQVLIQVSLNGLSYVSSNVTLTFRYCVPIDWTLIFSILGSLLLFLLALLLCFLWFLWPVITGVTYKMPAKYVDPAPLPPPPEPRKWPVVNASLYGRPGAGGMMPTRVGWGNTGATEMGAKLMKAKDGVILREESSPLVELDQPEIEKRSFCNKCCEPFSRCYHCIQSVRPIRGDDGKWFSWKKL
ncbi:Anthrax toxin receptor 2-like [Oopsacas minuta]|uniref:Anthrax toxin receptor 2-like n=1 Tax=Oopsacas minuta TaxID=111878 RepID=A0AAV7JDM1_9METZ|nr:Anthrax toxin receptor 2-like [Oopsacas minuta]